MPEPVLGETLAAPPRPVLPRQVRSRRINLALGSIAAAAVLVLGALAWWQWHGSPRVAMEAAPPTPAAASAPVSLAPAVPAINYPIENAQPASPVALPTLSESDAVLAQAIGQLIGRDKVLAQLQMDGFVRRFVATVDNLARAHAAPRLWPVNPAPQRFSVAAQGELVLIGADNALRYTPFVLLVESLDVERAVSLYKSMYPLFQQAYEELGYPRKYFNDRLVQVIDHLLAAPEPAKPAAVRLVDVQGPVKLSRPWLHYEFVDPALESLSAGQKIMVRVGPVNERRLKARLAAIRAAVVARVAAK